MQYIKHAVILTLTILLWIALATAETYFVNEDGGNDSNDGLSQTQAWKTVEKVNSASLSSGDIVRFQAGDVWFPTGKMLPQNGVTYTRYGSGANPVIDGGATDGIGGVIPDELKNALFQADPGNNIVIDGLDFRNSAQYVIRFDDSNNTTIKNMKAHGCGGSCIVFLNSSNILLDNIEVFDQTHNPHEAVAFTQASTDIIMRNSHVHDVKFAAMDIKGFSGRAVFHDNLIQRVSSDVQFYVERAFDVELYNNVVHTRGPQDCKPLFMVGVENLGTPERNVNIDVHHNVIYDACRSGFRLWIEPEVDGGTAGEFKMDNIKVRHNTIVMTNTFEQGTFDALDVRDDRTPAKPEQWRDILIENNIVWDVRGTGRSISIKDGISVTSRNNLVQTGAIGDFGTNPVITSDVKFVDEANADYRLRAGSPAIGAGTGGSDIGAFPFAPSGESDTYGTALESCTTTQITGTTGLIVVPDSQPDIRIAVESNTDTTILVKAGNYSSNGFDIGTDNIVKPYNCESVTLTLVNNSDTNLNNDGWTLAGFNINCQTLTDNNNNNLCIKLLEADNIIFRNNFVFDAARAFSFADGTSNALVHGNIFEGVRNTRVGDFIKFTGDIDSNTFLQNWVRMDPLNTTPGNDGISINSVELGTGNLITDNLFTTPHNIEQLFDFKQTEDGNAGVEVSYNTFEGPHTGAGQGTTESPSPMSIGDHVDCKTNDNCPVHHIHHNYFLNAYSQDGSPSGNFRAFPIQIGPVRYASGIFEFNVDNNDRNGSQYDRPNAHSHGFIVRHNTFYTDATRFREEICTDTFTPGANLVVDNNVFSNSRIEDECSGTPDWDITNNVFSNIVGTGFNHQDSGNSNDTISFGSTVDSAPDFTVLGGTHSAKGALPPPVFDSASIGDACVLNIGMTPFSGFGHDHGPLSMFDRNKVTVEYDSVVQSHVSGTIAPSINVLKLTMTACPDATDVVTFSATYGWCADFANIGGTETAMHAQCLAVTDQAVTNNVAGSPPTTFYVDASCGTNGDGTTETCGASGPWNSIKNALEVAQCTGMTEGDTLEIKGDVTKDVTCENGGVCYFEDNVNFPIECDGIIVENAANEHVVVNGTTDVSGNTWVSVGSGVYECTTSGCGGGIGDAFPFTAWYDRGAGEERLDLIQSNTTCDTSLAAGTMRVDPTDQSICAHLSDGSDPSSASYFRVPTLDPFLQAFNETAGNVTIRVNPSGGSFTVTRYRSNGFEMHVEDNPGWTIDGLEVSWMLNRCISSLGTAGQAGVKLLNNTLAFCGQEAIRVNNDLGAFEITGNTITDTQTEPVFERCSGVGSGCLSGFVDDGIAIKIKSRDGVGGLVKNNTILRFGGGNRGQAHAIFANTYNQNNVVEANYIAHASGLPLNGYGIKMTCDTANQLQDNNVYRNNRIYDVDICYAQTYDSVCSSQLGTANFFQHNTCADPNVYGMTSEGVGIQNGDLNVQNNIFTADATSPVFFNAVAADSGWNNFEFNAMECNGCAFEQDIISFKGQTVERPGDCDTGTDCLEDFNGTSAEIDSNLYGPLNVVLTGSEPTLQIDSSSFAFDAALGLLGVTEDYLGTARPQFGANDIGAHEVTTLGGPTGSLEQQSFQFFGRFMGPGLQPLMSENSDLFTFLNGHVTLRFAIISTAGGTSNQQFVLMARKCTPSCGAWGAVDLNSASSLGVYIVDHPVRTNREVLDNQMDLDTRTFVTGGLFIDADANPISIATIPQDHQIELEYSLGVSSGAAIGNTTELRIEKSGGTDLDVYTQTPVMTIVKGRKSMEGGIQQ